MPKFADMNKFKQLTTYNIEMFYLNSTINFGIPLVLVFQLEVYCKVDRLLTGLTAQQEGTTARWYSNKTSLVLVKISIFSAGDYNTTLFKIHLLG